MVRLALPVDFPVVARQPALVLLRSPGTIRRAPLAVVPVLMLGALLVMSQLYLTVPLLPGLRVHYGLAASTAAWAGSGFGLAYAVGNLIFGAASDRFDRRKVMAYGLLAGAVVAVMAGLSANFELLLVARFVQGFVAASFPQVSLAYVSEVLPERYRVIGLASVSSCFPLACLVGQGFALGVNDLWGWRWVFWALVPVLVVCAIAVRRLPPVPALPARATRLRELVASLGRLMTRPPLLVAYVCAAALIVSLVAMYTALNAAATARYGIGGVGPLLLLRLPGLPGILIGACSGVLIRWYGMRGVGTVALLVGGAGLVLEAVATSLIAMLIGSAVFMLGMAVSVPSAIAIIGGSSGAARGAAMSGYGVIIGLGSGLAPHLVTATSGMGFGGLCLVLAGLMAVAALGVLLVARA